MKYTIVKRCEWDKKIDEIYQAVHEVDASDNLGDISKVKGDDIPPIDIFFHSSPCQNFSNINMTQKTGGDEGTENQSSLMWESLRLLKEHPETKIVLWENVSAACRGKNKDNFDKYINTLNELGFTSFPKILNPRDFGIPQNRSRLFVVSINRKYLDPAVFKMPMETYEECDMFDYLDRNVDKKYIVPQRVMIGYDNKKSIFRDRWLIKKPGDTAYCLVAKNGRSTITCNYLFNDWNLYDNLPCELSAKGLHFLAENADKYPVRALTPKEFWRLQSIPIQSLIKKENPYHACEFIDQDFGRKDYWESSSWTHYLEDYYVPKNNEGKREIDWDKWHGWKRKKLKTYLHNMNKRIIKQFEIWNKYCGKEDILYIHSRCGGGNWSYFNKDIINQPGYIETVFDSFDGTYADHYFKIPKELLKGEENE